MNEHVTVFLIFISVSSFSYLFGWYMPKKILTSGPGELDYLNIKKKIKNKIKKLKVVYCTVVLSLDYKRQPSEDQNHKE